MESRHCSDHQEEPGESYVVKLKKILRLTFKHHIEIPWLRSTWLAALVFRSNIKFNLMMEPYLDLRQSWCSVCYSLNIITICFKNHLFMFQSGAASNLKMTIIWENQVSVLSSRLWGPSITIIPELWLLQINKTICWHPVQDSPGHTDRMA